VVPPPDGRCTAFPHRTWPIFVAELRSLKYTDTFHSAMTEAQTAVENGGVVRDLTAFQQNILVILAEEPMYGLAIKSQLETYYGR